MDRLAAYRKGIDTCVTKRNILQDQLEEKLVLIDEHKRYLEGLIRAKLILSEAAKRMQQDFAAYLEAIVTKALTAVYDRPFRFVVDFKLSRSTSECFLYVQDGDKALEVPKLAMGGGCLDVISVALRLAALSLQQPNSSSVLILDEPMKFVGEGELLNNAVLMLKEISSKLGFQLIIITHETEILTGIADKVFTVTHNGIESTVRSVCND